MSEFKNCPVYREDQVLPDESKNCSLCGKHSASEVDHAGFYQSDIFPFKLIRWINQTLNNFSIINSYATMEDAKEAKKVLLETMKESSRSERARIDIKVVLEVGQKVRLKVCDSFLDMTTKADDKISTITKVNEIDSSLCFVDNYCGWLSVEHIHNFEYQA